MLDERNIPLNVTITFLSTDHNTYLTPASALLLESIHSPDSLVAKSIGSIELVGDVADIWTSGLQAVEPVKVLKDLFKVLHCNVHYRFNNTPYVNELEVALANQQLENMSLMILCARVIKPRASIKAASSDFIQLHLLTAFTNFEITSDELGEDVDFLRDVLAYSLKQLESLNIPLTISTIPLERCLNLHKLKVRFVEAHYHEDQQTWTRSSNGKGPAMNLVDTLASTSIRRLILAGFPVEEELVYLFNNEDPAFTLPDFVVTFSIEFFVRPRYLLPLVRNLSLQSQLEEWNVTKVEGFEDEVMEEFEEECGRRKIELTFNRIWEL